MDKEKMTYKEIRKQNKIKNSRFEGWSIDKLTMRANKIIEIINDKGLSKKNIALLNETFELIITRLKVIAWNDDDLINRTSKPITNTFNIKFKRFLDEVEDKNA